MNVDLTEDEIDLVCTAMAIYMGMAADGYINPSGEEEIAMIGLVHKIAIAVGKDDIAEEALELAEEWDVPFSPALT